MRDIKFRVWNKEHEKMWTHELMQRNSIFTLHPDLPNKEFLVIPNSENHILMQYTGFKDKNGVEIYEGDIVSYKTKYYGKVKEGNKQVIKWEDDLEHDGFGQPWATGFIIHGYDWEVIGNIYENPELLKTA